MKPTPESATAPAAKSSKPAFDPAQFFANKDRLARWCVLAMLVTALGTFASLMLVFRLLSQPPIFVPMADSPEPAGPFDKVNQLHVQQALWATSALLSRTQNEFDYPEALRAMFTHQANAAALALKSSEAQEFHDKALSQKPEVSRIESQETRPDQVRVLVIGRLDRNGTVQGQALTETLPFKLFLTLRLNPDLISNRSQPVFISEFQLKYEN